MSVKGSPHHWFRAAVSRGDLATAISEASELGRPLQLADALGLVVLLGEAADARHSRWAARWVARVALSDEAVDLEALAELIRTIAAAPVLGAPGRDAIGALAERHGVNGAARLLLPALSGHGGSSLSR